MRRPRPAGRPRGAPARQYRSEQCLGPPGRARRIRGLQADGGQLGTVPSCGRTRVDQQPGLTLLPQVDRLAAVPGRAGEAERFEDLRQRFDVGSDQFGERDAGRYDGGGRLGEADALLQHEQRTQRVDGGRPGLRLPEHVVEHFQRERPFISGTHHMPDEPGDVEAALPGETAVVPAPLQHVHRHQRRVGQLQEEDLLAGDVLDPLGIGTARQDVKTVQARPERGMVGGLDDAPGMVVRTDVAAPRQRLVRDADAEPLGQFGEPPQLERGQRVVVLGERRHAGAHEHGVGPEPLHQPELVLGPPQIPRELLRGHGLDVTHRLVEIDAQPEIGAAGPHLLGREGAGEQVVLEDLDTVEARRAAAVSFSVRAPLRETVAMDVRTLMLLRFHFTTQLGPRFCL